MHHQRVRLRRRIVRIIGSAGVVVLFVAAIWIDIATGLWQAQQKVAEANGVIAAAVTELEHALGLTARA